MHLIAFGKDSDIITLHAAATTFAKPTSDSFGGSLERFRTAYGGSPPDVLIRIIGAAAWAFDEACGLYGMLDDGTWDRAEAPLGGGGILSGLAGIGQTYATAMGGYKRLAIAQWDGGTLTASQAVAVYAIPAFTRSV